MVRNFRLLSMLAAAIIAGTGLVGRLPAEDVRILAPYVGIIRNTVDYGEYKLDLEDTDLMKGLYFQWIDPASYQWNLFVYQASDVNYSGLWGGHFIFDKYFGPEEDGSFLVGAGFEIIDVRMDAGNDITPLKAFEFTNTVTVPYLRAGKYFLAGGGPVRLSLLPWAGLQPQWTTGDVGFTVPFPPPGTKVSETIDDYEFFGIAGINLKILFARYADLELKYQAAFNRDEYLSTVTLIANGYLSRNWGLSYRMKYMENTSGSDLYHLFGAAYIF